LSIAPPDKNDKRESRKEREGRSPTAPETMPYFFPGRSG
jgi:hypothetical protein